MQGAIEGYALVQIADVLSSQLIDVLPCLHKANLRSPLHLDHA